MLQKINKLYLRNNNILYPLNLNSTSIYIEKHYPSTEEEKNEANGNWYRQWSDGLIEQTIVVREITSNVDFNFLVPFTNLDSMALKLESAVDASIINGHLSNITLMGGTIVFPGTQYIGKLLVYAAGR